MQQAAILCLILLLTGGCAGPDKSLYPPALDEPVRTVYLITSGGLHTGIAVARADIPDDLWPSKHDYPQARYLEIGWGDHDGYRKDLTPWIVFKALFWPTRSVLQLDGFTNSVAANFDDPRSTIIEIKLSERGFRRLCAHISKTHALDKAGQPVRLGDDWYGARGKYCVFNTCNTWVARGLRAAGCPVTPVYCLTRGPLLYQVRKFGEVLRTPATKPKPEQKP